MKWSAFAAEFDEVDENVEYHEKESEFDLEDEAAAAVRTRAAEDAEVDVLGAERHAYVGPHNGGRVFRGRTAALESALGDDEDVQWAEDGSADDMAPWVFRVALDDDDDDE